MESEGCSPLRILRHALMTSEVFIAGLFLPKKKSPIILGKYFQAVGTFPVPLGFREWMSPFGRDALTRRHRNCALASGDRRWADFSGLGERDLSRVPSGQSNQ